MFWIFAGFLLVVVVETVIRVSSNYEPERRREPARTQISLPWYGWGLLGYSVLKKNKRRK